MASRRSWLTKFAVALRGLRRGVAGQDSFLVHIPIAVAVMAAGFWWDLSPERWLLLVLCIGVVLGAELFNTALERLARAVTREHDENIRDALDIASGAVLLLSLTAAVVGVVVFGTG